MTALRLVALAAIALLVCRAPRAQQALVDFGAPCAWIANSADPGVDAGWFAEGFDDSAWAAGSYGIGYETGSGALALLQTVVPVDSSSVYTRTRFTVADPAAITGLALGVDYDDAVAAWINGVEVWRSAEMPAGATAWDTNPSGHECSNAAAPVFTPYADITTFGLQALRAGVNVLAIAAWNDSIPSSDLVLVPRLVANAPPALLRGPYLQMSTQDAITIRWRTLSPADSVVRWGDAPGNLTNVLADAVPAIDHEVRITGLSPATRYYYSVGMTGQVLAGDDATHSFTTPPPRGTRAPLRAWVVGDSGTADANARRVRDAWRAREAGRIPDFWLMLGDNAYTGGTDSQYQSAVFDTYPQELRQSVVWPTFGNHDALSAAATTESGVYFDVFTLPRFAENGGVPSGTEAYWSFDWANVHFICLDSQESDRSTTGAMADWLARDIASTSQDWVVAYFHHPPYTKGSHDSDTEYRHVEIRENILPILEDGGVDLILSGHSHSYERSFLVNGHHGLSTELLPQNILDNGDGRETGDGAYAKPQPGVPHAGEVCVVAGNSGKTETGPLDHPVMFLSLEVLGSFILDIAGDRLDGTFLDDQGFVRDQFAIVKLLPSLAEDCANGIDDDGDGLTDCDDRDCRSLDDDGDGAPNCTDCAPVDAGSFAAPPEIAVLRVAKAAPGSSEARLAWGDVGAACGAGVVADCATGAITEMWADAGFARASCLARDVIGTAVGDVRLAPRSSDGYWYLVRARNSCGSGPWAAALPTLTGCP